MILAPASSNRVKPFYLLVLGSSSTDGEDKDLSQLRDLRTRMSYSGHSYSVYDVASHFETAPLIFENETYKQSVIDTEGMIEYDIIIKMPPRKKYSIKAKITRIRKAEPRIVIPEKPYTGI